MLANPDATSDGQFTDSLMGEYNSRATHNGIVASQQAHDTGRGAAVQATHAVEGKGSFAK